MFRWKAANDFVKDVQMLIDKCFAIPQVHSAYPVLHNETDEEVEFDSDYEQKMYRIHQTVNPLDMVIGW